MTPATATAFIAAWNAGDETALCALLAPQLRYADAHAGERRDRESYLSFLREIRAALPRARLTFDGVDGHGRFTLIAFSLSGLSGEMNGRSGYFYVAQDEDGRVTELIGFSDPRARAEHT